jgi:hypothetical protein
LLIPISVRSLCAKWLTYSIEKLAIFERVVTEHESKSGLEILGYWINSRADRVTGILDFANR